MLESLKTTKLSLIPTTFFLGVFLFVLIRFFVGDYYAIYTASLGSIFDSKIIINLNPEYNAGDFHLPSVFTADVTELKGEILAARIFIDNEERNIRPDNTRPYEVINQDGKTIIRFLYTIVPFSELEDKNHLVKVMFVHGNLNNFKLATAKKRVLTDYMQPEISFEGNTNNMQSFKIIVTDQGSGIESVFVDEVDYKNLEFIPTKNTITPVSVSRSRGEYLINVPDSKKDYVIMVADKAGNKTFSSLSEKTADEIFERIVIERLSKKSITRTLPTTGDPEAAGLCDVWIKHYYYDESEGDGFEKGWWGKNPQGKPYKEILLGAAHTQGVDSVKSILNREISTHQFNPPTFMDFESGLPKLDIERLDIETGSTLIALGGQTISNGTTIIPLEGKVVKVFINSLESFSNYIRAKVDQLVVDGSHIIPIVYVDEVIGGNNFAYTFILNGVIIVDHLIHIDTDFQFQLNISKIALAHEISHIHGLGHIESTSNLMYESAASLTSTAIELDQAAAFMAHTRNCFDQAYEPEKVGHFQSISTGIQVFKCGQLENRILGGRSGSPSIEQCDDTFSSGFNPTPGATQVQLGAGVSGNPLSYCPIITDPTPNRSVLGVTIKNVAQRIAEGYEIRYCAPPPYSEQCTCMTRPEILQTTWGSGVVFPDNTSTLSPLKPETKTSDTPNVPSSTAYCGDGKLTGGEQCEVGMTANCSVGEKCENCQCVNACGDGEIDPGEQCGEPGLTCAGTFGITAPGYQLQCVPETCKCISVPVPGPE